MVVRQDTIFLTESGMLDESSYPEILSQAIAAQEGFRKLGCRNAQPEGYLLGLKRLEILGNAAVGDRLTVSVRKVAKYGDFGIIQGEVRRGDYVIARGELKVYQNDGTAA